MFVLFILFIGLVLWLWKTNRLNRYIYNVRRASFKYVILKPLVFILNKNGGASAIKNLILACTDDAAIPEAIVSENTIKITFHLHDEKYNIHLPYNKRQHRGTQYMMFTTDRGWILLDHHPCIPFYLTAKSLNVPYIRVFNIEKEYKIEYVGDDVVLCPIFTEID